MRTILLYGCLFVLTAAPVFAFAQTSDFQSLANYQNTQLQSVYSGGGDLTGAALSAIINNFFTIAIGVIAGLVILRTIWAGYLIGQKGDSWQKQSEARQILSTAWGTFLLFLAGMLIFAVIDPCIASAPARLFHDLTGSGSVECPSPSAMVSPARRAG